MKATALRLTSVFAVVLAFSAVSAYGQSVIKRQTFVVPFEFSVGGKVMPAGEYAVSGETLIVRIQSKDRKQNVVVLPVSTRIGPLSRTEVKLKFRRYGDQYYLAQVWLPDGVGRELRRERRTDSDVAANYGMVEITAAGR
jgi:hypothetical protein